MDKSNKNKADEELRRQSSRKFKAPEERPYRRRIKPQPDKVHHVGPARFRHFVQRRTCYSLMPPQPNNVTTLPASDPDDDDDAAASTPTSGTTSSPLSHQPQPMLLLAAVIQPLLTQQDASSAPLGNRCRRLTWRGAPPTISRSAPEPWGSCHSQCVHPFSSDLITGEGEERI